jgi:hypothetical protein
LGQSTADLHTRPTHLSPDKAADGIFSLPGPESLGGWEFWDRVVQSPSQLKATQLKDAARQLGLQVGDDRRCTEKGGGLSWGGRAQGGEAVVDSPVQVQLTQLKDTARYLGLQVSDG